MTTSIEKWYEAERGDVHNVLFSTFEDIERQGASRLFAWALYFSVYSGRMVSDGFKPWEFPKHNLEPALTYNGTLQVVDTLCADITAQDPAPYFIVTNGPEQLQTKAEKMQQLVDGVMLEADVDDACYQALRDAAVIGIGHVKTYADERQCKVDHCPPGSIWVDPLAGRKPNIYYHVSYVPREELLRMFPGHSERLENESPEAMTVDGGLTAVPDLIKVVEAWKNDYRHVICTETLTLLDEEWKGRHPIREIRFSVPMLYGYWSSMGLVEMCYPVQLQSDYLTEKMQLQEEGAANPFLITDSQSEIPIEHIQSNIPLRILRIGPGGSPPTVVTPGFANPQQFQMLADCHQKIFDISGVSQISAHSQIPAGMGGASGVALRTWHDLESKKFSQIAKRYEKFKCGISEDIVRTLRSIYEAYPDWSIAVKVKKSMSRLKWADVALEEEQYMLQVKPVSAMPTTVAAKLAYVQEEISSGLITSAEAREQLDMPDIERDAMMSNAPLNYLKDGLDRMAAEEDFQLQPSLFIDLPLAEKLAGNRWCKLAMDGAPPELLQKFETFALECRRMMQAMQPPPPPPPVATPGPPTGMMEPGMVPPGPPIELPPEMTAPPMA